MFVSSIVVLMLHINSQYLVSCTEYDIKDSSNSSFVSPSDLRANETSAVSSESASSARTVFFNASAASSGTTATTTVGLSATSTSSSSTMETKMTSTKAETGQKLISPTTSTYAASASSASPSISENSNTTECQENFNANLNLSVFWLQTDLLSVAMDTNASSCRWQFEMTVKLLELLKTAFGKNDENDTLQVQLVSATRRDGNFSQQVRLVYAIRRNGEYGSAAKCAALINRGIGADRASLLLGYEVSLPIATAALIESPSTFDNAIDSDRSHWHRLAVAAAAASGFVLIAVCLVTSAVLSLYFGCLRPSGHDGSRMRTSKRQRRGRRRRRLRCGRRCGRGGWTVYDDGDAEDDDDEVRLPAGSAWPVLAHMRANPKISYSAAGIEAIADQVTRRLEAHMCELVLGWQNQQQQQPPQPHQRTQRQSTSTTSAGSPTPAAEVAGSNDACIVELSLSTDRQQQNDDDGDDDEEVQLRRCPQTNPADSSDGQLTRPNGKGRSIESEKKSSGSGSGSDRRHSALERHRNKERLRSIQVGKEDGSVCLQQPTAEAPADHAPSLPLSRPRMPRLGLRAAAAAAASTSTRRAESMLEQHNWEPPPPVQQTTGRVVSGGPGPLLGLESPDTACCFVKPFLESTDAEVVHL